MDDSTHQHDRSGSHDHVSVTLPKKLILCCDGTWMDSDNGWVGGNLGHVQIPSNVTRIARAIKPEDDGHHPQIVYYQAGIGTGMGLESRLLGGGTGLGLAEHIREAYAFLASNYRENDPDRLIPNDSIFILGFSRGAYTARSIAGLLGGVGLLKKRAMAHFYEIFMDYENAGNPLHKPLFWDRFFASNPDIKRVEPPVQLAHDKNRVAEYLRAYRNILLGLDLTQEAEIKCVGVWDTVGALGVPVNPILQHVFPWLPSFVREYSFFDTSLDNHIANAFQALALDEHRYPFSPTLWEKKDGVRTNLKQVWFPGAHANVGGSYADSGMADIALAWMMDQLAGNTTEHPDGFAPHDWIKFDDQYINYWYDNELKWLDANKAVAYRGWAMGHVYDSTTFPISLLGARIRTPGRYHRVDAATGKPDPARLLRNTHEAVHSCVRARIDLGGRGVEPEESAGAWLPWLRTLLGWPPRTYLPQRARSGPLHGWRLVDGHRSHRAANMGIDVTPDAGLADVEWRWEGAAADCAMPGARMPEDRLGPYERKLLRKDRRLAEQIVFSNNGWHWLDEPDAHLKSRARTVPITK